MVVMNGKIAISLAAQMYKLKSYFPESQCNWANCGNSIVWKGWLQPSVLSERYLIKIIYQRNRTPDVYVLSPKPLRKPEGQKLLKHTYNTESQHLCIYYRRAKEWEANMYIADIIIPWICEWLLHYEFWVATGEWHGGGIEH